MHFLRLRFPRVTSLIVLGGVLVALLLGWTAPAHATGERLVDDYRSVYGTPGVAAAVIDGTSVETIVRGRDGDGNAVTARTRFRIAGRSHSAVASGASAAPVRRPSHRHSRPRRTADLGGNLAGTARTGPGAALPGCG
ncbi:hypothetical protein AB0395_04720 [Streptosporangium sp. NPDC051023]|uniref:hypothetical protein n=1 Tax=Streptosporangium sp. NPDC051023 TaxID=3155410 RepID=UPI00344E61CC